MDRVAIAVLPSVVFLGENGFLTAHVDHGDPGEPETDVWVKDVPPVFYGVTVRVLSGD